jgi:hypothetical protein
MASIVSSLSTRDSDNPISIANCMANMVIHAIRSAAIVAAVATGGTLAHGVAGMVGDGVVG